MALSKEESNYKKLRRSPIAMNFVKRHQGNWNHQDTDQVGLLLEEKKAQYLASKNA